MARDIFPKLKTLFGKHIDSEEVVKFLAKYPKHRVTKPSDGHQNVVAPAHGFDMAFSPPDGAYRGGRTKELRVLTSIFLHSDSMPKYKAFTNLPLGLSFDHSHDQLTAKLGPPYRSSKRDNGEVDWAKWRVDELVLHADFKRDQPTTGHFTLMTSLVAARFD
jgi:hypothetical protein